MPQPSQILIRGRRVLTSKGVGPATILIEGGRIRSVTPFDATLPGRAALIDAEDAHVLPGLVDAFVHLEGGDAEPSRRILDTTRAAVAGGITTVAGVLPPGLGYEAFVEASRGAAACDVAAWLRADPAAPDTVEAALERGAAGLAAAMGPVEGLSLPVLDEAGVRAAMAVAARRGVPVALHAECAPPFIPNATATTQYHAYLEARSPDYEREAIMAAIRAAAEAQATTFLPAVSAAAGLDVLREAVASGIPVVAGTAPHYVALDGSQVPPGATEYKAAPPIRPREHSHALRNALLRGPVTVVTSGHVAWSPREKCRQTGDFFAAAAGINGIQALLHGLWDIADEAQLGIEQAVSLLSTAPARLLGFDHRKGRIAPGYDADLFFFDPEASTHLTASTLVHPQKMTPWFGRTLRGAVRRTYVRGVEVFRDGAMHEPFAGVHLRHL